MRKNWIFFFSIISYRTPEATHKTYLSGFNLKRIINTEFRSMTKKDKKTVKKILNILSNKIDDCEFDLEKLNIKSDPKTFKTDQKIIVIKPGDLWQTFECMEGFRSQ